MGGLDIQFSRHSVRATVALFSAWFIMGLWHGASWNFALWGLRHATFIYAHRKTNRYFAPLPAPLRGVRGWGTTLSVVMLGWIFFRARSVTTALGLYARLFDFGSYRHLGFRKTQYLIVFAIMLAMLLLRLLSTNRFGDFFARYGLREPTEILVLSGTIFAVFIFLHPVSQFIYFQF